MIRTIRDDIDHIGHIHSAGNPERNDLDEVQEIFSPPVMRANSESPYTRYVGHEFVPTRDPFAVMKTAYAMCDM